MVLITTVMGYRSQLWNLFYADADEDGYGDASVELVSCERPRTY